LPADTCSIICSLHVDPSTGPVLVSAWIVDRSGDRHFQQSHPQALEAGRHLLRFERNTNWTGNGRRSTAADWAACQRFGITLCATQSGQPGQAGLCH